MKHDQGFDEEQLALSNLVLSLGDSDQDPVSFADIVARFGRRALGAVLFIFALLCLLPLPPGSTTVLGLPLLMLAPQLAWGARTPWLPRFLARRTVSRSVLNRACRRAAPWVVRIERLMRRRCAFMFGSAGDRLVGAVCTLLALVIVLPIPLGNVLPSMSVAVLSLSLVHRDGAFAIAGYLLSFASATVLAIAGGLAWIAAERLTGGFGPV
jgi:hypothetical protein